MGDGTADQRSQVARENPPSLRPQGGLAAENAMDALDEEGIVTVAPVASTRNRRNAHNIPHSQATVVRGTRGSFVAEAERRRAESSITIARQLADITSDMNRRPAPQIECTSDILRNYRKAKRFRRECEDENDTRGYDFYDRHMKQMEEALDRS